MTRLLFSISPADPLTYVVVAMTVMVVALCACLAPARRAARVDPIVALRHE
jgi:putative ABC transport system permease protein